VRVPTWAHAIETESATIDTLASAHSRGITPDPDVAAELCRHYREENQFASSLPEERLKVLSVHYLRAVACLYCIELLRVFEKRHGELVRAEHVPLSLVEHERPSLPEGSCVAQSESGEIFIRVTRGSLDINYSAGQPLIILASVFRPFIGLVFGFLLYAFIEGKLTTFVSVPADADRPLFSVAMGFIAGFSERLVPRLIASTEGDTRDDYSAPKHPPSKNDADHDAST
jgi:hypothetical protein